MNLSSYVQRLLIRWSFGVLMWEVWSLGDELYDEVIDIVDYLKGGRRLHQPAYANVAMFVLPSPPSKHKSHELPVSGIRRSRGLQFRVPVFECIYIFLFI